MSALCGLYQEFDNSNLFFIALKIKKPHLACIKNHSRRNVSCLVIVITIPSTGHY